ncbi:MAG: hypothetical protein ACK4FW_11240 [Stenotrophomonas sp.]
MPEKFESMRHRAAAALGLLLLADVAGAGAPVHDRAGNRLEALIEQPDRATAGSDDGTASPRFCTEDRQWCVRTQRDGDPSAAQLEVEHRLAGETEPRLRYIPMPEPETRASERPWPFIVRMAPGIGALQAPSDPQQAALENVLVGVVSEASAGYSGGGSDAGKLRLSRLYHQQDGIQIDPDVLMVPGDGHAMIRACFGQADEARRAGACHDEYGFSMTLTLDPAGQGMPVLRYRTTATRFPAGASRLQDASTKGPLRKRDLRIQTDPTCSYQRTFRFVGGAYVPDTPLPGCEEFTEL